MDMGSVFSEDDDLSSKVDSVPALKSHCNINWDNDSSCSNDEPMPELSELCYCDWDREDEDKVEIFGTTRVSMMKSGWMDAWMNWDVSVMRNCNSLMTRSY